MRVSSQRSSRCPPWRTKATTPISTANVLASPRPHRSKAATTRPRVVKTVSADVPGRLRVPTTPSAACACSSENVDPPASMSPRLAHSAASSSSTSQTLRRRAGLKKQGKRGDRRRPAKQPRVAQRARSLDQRGQRGVVLCAWGDGQVHTLDELRGELGGR